MNRPHHPVHPERYVRSGSEDVIYGPDGVGPGPGTWGPGEAVLQGSSETFKTGTTGERVVHEGDTGTGSLAEKELRRDLAQSPPSGDEAVRWVGDRGP